MHWGASRVPERPRGEQFDPLASLGDELLESADVVIFPECWRAHDGSSFLDRIAEYGFSSTRETRYRTLQISRRGNHLADPGEGWWNLAIASRHEILATTELPLARSFQDVVPIRRAISIRIAVDKQPVDVTAFHVSSKVWFGAPALHGMLTPRADRPGQAAGESGHPGLRSQRVHARRRPARPRHRPRKQGRLDDSFKSTYRPLPRTPRRDSARVRDP